MITKIIPKDSQSAPNCTASQAMPLTSFEQDLLETCLLVCEDEGISYEVVGQALEKIRDRELYRHSHDSWVAFCSTTLRWSASQANRHIRAASVVAELARLVPQAIATTSDWFLPKNEAQVRPLLSISDSNLQLQIWLEVVERAKHQKLNATLVKQVVVEFTQELETNADLNSEAQTNSSEMTELKSRFIDLQESFTAGLERAIESRDWSLAEELLEWGEIEIEKTKD